MARVSASSFCNTIVEVVGHHTPEANDENHQESAFAPGNVGFCQVSNHLHQHEEAKEGHEDGTNGQPHSFNEWGRDFLCAMRDIVDGFCVKDDSTKQEN